MFSHETRKMYVNGNNDAHNVFDALSATFILPFNVNYEVEVNVLAERTLVFVWSTHL